MAQSAPPAHLIELRKRVRLMYALALVGIGIIAGVYLFLVWQCRRGCTSFGLLMLTALPFVGVAAAWVGWRTYRKETIAFYGSLLESGDGLGRDAPEMPRADPPAPSSSS